MTLEEDEYGLSRHLSLVNSNESCYKNFRVENLSKCLIDACFLQEKDEVLSTEEIVHHAQLSKSGPLNEGQPYAYFASAQSLYRY